MAALTQCFVPNIKSSSKTTQEKLIVMKKGWAQNKGVIGSSYVEMGNSKVSCYVYAPRPSGTKSIDFDEGLLECEIKFAGHLTNTDIFNPMMNDGDGNDLINDISTRLSDAVIQALSPSIILSSYPKSTILISAIFLESSSDDISALINGCSLALCDALVEMRDIVSASSFLYPNNNSNNLNETTNEEEEDTSLVCNIASMANLNNITYLNIIGRSNPSMVLKLIEIGSVQCQKIREIISNAIKSTN